MKNLIVLLTVLLSFNTQALELIISGFSHHLEKPVEAGVLPYEYNEVNPGAGIEHNNFEFIIVENSHSNTSVVAAYNLRKHVNQHLDVSLKLGGATGYENIPVRPVIIPTVTVWFKQVGIETGYIVDTSGDLYGTFTFNARVRF